MFEKIKSFLPTIVDKVKTGLQNTPKPVKWIGMLYGVFVACVLMLYLAVFCYEFLHGQSKSADLLPFINIIVGGAFVGFVTFLVGLCIDSNGDGIPDTFEKEQKQ